MLLARPPARCPQCRKEIVEKDIGTDLIAQSIIDELEILCASEECPWRVKILISRANIDFSKSIWKNVS